MIFLPRQCWPVPGALTFIRGRAPREGRTHAGPTPGSHALASPEQLLLAHLQGDRKAGSGELGSGPHIRECWKSASCAWGLRLTPHRPRELSRWPSALRLSGTCTGLLDLIFNCAKTYKTQHLPSCPFFSVCAAEESTTILPIFKCTVWWHYVHSQTWPGPMPLFHLHPPLSTECK